MRTAFYKLLLVAAIPVVFAACKKEGIMTYNASDNIFFNYKTGVDPSRDQLGFVIDSLDFTFAYSAASVTDTLFPIPVGVSGAPAATDRTYKVVIDAGATAVEGKHYNFTPLVVKAGRVTDTLWIHFNRTADLMQGKVSMTLHLVPNENFSTDIERRLEHSDKDTINIIQFRLSLSDMLTEGPDWNSYETYFGTFSEKKVRLMNQIVGLPLDFWAYGNGLSGADIANAVYYATSMSRYLSQQAAAGNTIYDEDGVTPMKMGTDYQ
ncbi:protein of unknown function [Filimonas lacunae]|uniref:DUF4843 domain-containing protein n=1 Tax=Filimonas lacunae TaxID=477680 RepID=A0A173MHQ2_9BACT|nr:DUF4843 domain-containing protein [Filimonas lacunae]BAV06948.1 hypothetical protein FLA_2968 [Filimonas lacunae]SIS97362.1 protein of unknown function [Filimonas lacunae]